MSVTVMAPTPALPPIRRPSVWGKVFGGFRISHDKKREEDEHMNVEDISEKMDLSVSTAVEHAARPTLQQRHSSLAVKEAPRRVSRPASIKSTKTSASRTPSVSSTFSRRTLSRKSSWFRSSNPEDDDTPPVPAIDRKFSFFSSHNPDDESLKSPVMPRSPSYVPRNAASSFLKTTTPMNKEGTEDKNEAVHKASSTPDLREKAAHLKPIMIKNIPLRKDANDQLENHGMHSMAGVCDIEEDEYEEDVPFSPMSIASSCISPTNVVFSHKRADTFMTSNTCRPMRPTPSRIDSAKTSAELLSIKNMHTIAIAELEA
ncbi:hypothetical protein MBLNU459_g5494t1 [Dothideomycetes sp. NU459]